MTSDGDGSRVVAVVRDLFFVARISETARLAGVPLEFARTPEDLATALVSRPHFVLLDLTGDLPEQGNVTSRVFETVAAAGNPPVLGFTTHVAARQTQPWHARCGRVVTKETLTQELPALLRDGVAA